MVAAEEAYRLARVGFDAGRISQLELRSTRSALIAALIPALAALFMGLLVRRRGRDERYAGLTPGVAPADGAEGEVVRGSGNPTLDRRAEAIARASGPFGRFTPEIRKDMDQMAMVAHFKFTRDQTLETNVR